MTATNTSKYEALQLESGQHDPRHGNRNAQIRSALEWVMGLDTYLPLGAGKSLTVLSRKRRPYM